MWFICKSDFNIFDQMKVSRFFKSDIAILARSVTKN